MSSFRLNAARLIGVVLPVLCILFSSTAVSAVEVQVHCWCKKQVTNICNHVVRPAEVPLSIGEAFARDRETTCSVCTEYCGTLEGDWSTTHCEPTYREDICGECTADENSSCTRERGAHGAFSTTCDPEAANTPITLGVPIGGVSQVSGLPQYINAAYRYMVSVILVIAIVMVVYGGFLYLLGAGGVGSVQRGKQIIKDALIGMVIVLAAYAILQTINSGTTQFKLSPTKIDCIAIPQNASTTGSGASGTCTCGAAGGILAGAVVTDSQREQGRSACQSYGGTFNETQLSCVGPATEVQCNEAGAALPTGVSCTWAP